MALLNRKELEEEIHAIGENIKAHEAQMALHVQGIKIDSFIKILFEQELKKFPKEKDAKKSKDLNTSIG